MPARTYTREADVKNEVKKLLKAHGWMYWMPAANGYGASGTADVQALKDGVFLAVETKFGRNSVSAMQETYLNGVAAHGGMAFVVSEARIGTFAAWLDAYDNACIAVRDGEQLDAQNHAQAAAAFAVELTQLK